MIKRVFPILAISVFSSMIGVGIITPLLPQYAEDLGATIIGIAVIFSAFSLSRAVFTPLIGRASDKRGRKMFISAGLLAFAIISIAYVWADTVPELILVRLLHGTAAGMIIPIAQAYIGDLSPQGQEGRWMGYFNAAFMAGFGLGPLIGGIMKDYATINVAFYTMGALNILALILALLLLPDTQGKRVEGAPLFTAMKSGVIRGLFAFRLTNAMGRGILFAFLPLFAGEDSAIGLTSVQVGTALTVNVLLISLLQVPLGRFADRFSTKKGLVAIGSLVDVMILCLIPFSTNFTQIILLCVIGSTGRAFSLPSASAMTVEEGRKYGMGTTTGIFNTAMSLGVAIGPFLGATTASLTNVSPVFFFGAIVGTLGITAFVWFTRGQ
ncbi:MAG: MFS transporter [Chloroflexota bacterium]|nr:MFS transporter [Chloroflexota bacterium]